MADAEAEKITEFSLENLLLDHENPRFGLQSRSSNQTDVLNTIVDTHGVDDVLSSLAVNGYFAAEPLVCQRDQDSGKATVRDGNRRLSACLIITGDDRARDQASRTLKYGKLWKQHGYPSIDPVPTIIFDGHDRDQTMLSYLGVRHIASSHAWDSYAKAAWVSRVVEESGLPLADVASMIGDKNNTISRMLEGYNFMQQLQETGKFIAEHSVRKGRGSITAYPFSWVYTILGYATVRNFLELGDDATQKKPIPEKNLERASLITQAMFGNSNSGKNAAVSDSRQLSFLAAAFSNQEQIELIEQGKTIEQVINMTLPLDERLRQGFGEMREIQGELIQALAEQVLPPDQALEFEPPATRNRKLATELLKQIKEATDAQEVED